MNNWVFHFFTRKTNIRKHLPHPSLFENFSAHTYTHTWRWWWWLWYQAVPCDVMCFCLFIFGNSLFLPHSYALIHSLFSYLSVSRARFIHCVSLSTQLFCHFLALLFPHFIWAYHLCLPRHRLSLARVRASAHLLPHCCSFCCLTIYQFVDLDFSLIFQFLIHISLSLFFTISHIGPGFSTLNFKFCDTLIWNNVIQHTYKFFDLNTVLYLSGRTFRFKWDPKPCRARERIQNILEKQLLFCWIEYIM